MKNINKSKRILNEPRKNKVVLKYIRVLSLSILILMILFSCVDAKFDIVTKTNNKKDK